MNTANVEELLETCIYFILEVKTGLWVHEAEHTDDINTAGVPEELISIASLVTALSADCM
jgi:hypothetical protein